MISCTLHIWITKLWMIGLRKNHQEPSTTTIRIWVAKLNWRQETLSLVGLFLTTFSPLPSTVARNFYPQILMMETWKIKLRLRIQTTKAPGYSQKMASFWKRMSQVSQRCWVSSIYRRSMLNGRILWKHWPRWRASLVAPSSQYLHHWLGSIMTAKSSWASLGMDQASSWAVLMSSKVIPILSRGPHRSNPIRRPRRNQAP